MKRHAHHTHPAIVRRLRRAQGHLGKVIAMIEAQRECVAIAQQLQAVEVAITRAKHLLIHDHIDHCLDERSHAGRRGNAHSLDEFRQITKFL